MPSTFSPSLKIELPSTGTQSGIWGLTTNNNLGTLVEQAVTGVQSIVMADANYTLTNYNGVSDEARNAVLVVTGTNAAVRDIVAPLVNKIYTIRNATTGGFGIRIIGVTGTGITIPNGYTTTVYCDSTNFNQSLSAVTGNFGVVGNAVVSGSLGVTGATALTTGAISGVVTAPTAAAGTNTTQIATTAFVTTAVASAFPSGTRLPFAQASAPTGWTQDTTDNANNRMLRVVSGTGNGVGGSASPILNNVVPSHTHGFTSGGQSVDHSHSGTTSSTDINHTHAFSGTSAGMNGNVTHNHMSTVYSSGGGPVTPYFQGTSGGLTASTTTADGTFAANIDHSHNVGGTTAGMDQSNPHSHTITTNGTSVGHVHSGTTNANGSASDWTPRYIDLIICAKN